MDETTMNTLYGWKGRIHKAMLVCEQFKLEYVRVCALSRTFRDKSLTGILSTTKGTTGNRDADAALTWSLLEAAMNIVEATCDGYISSIRRSFNAYRKIKEDNDLTFTTTAAANMDGDATIDEFVENIINSNVVFVEQWTEIISGAQKEKSGWKVEHKKYLDRKAVAEKIRRRKRRAALIIEDYEHDADDPLRIADRLFRIRLADDRLFRMGICVAAGKVLVSSHKIVSKITSIETATQEAGKACILGITQSAININNNNNNEDGGNDNGNGNNDDNGDDNGDADYYDDFDEYNDPDDYNDNDNNDDGNDGDENNGYDEMIYKSESEIVEEWDIQVKATKLDSVYRWYRMHNGTLSSAISVVPI